MKITFAVCLILASAGASAEWEPFSSTADSKVYLDRASIGPRGKYTKAWLLWDYKAEQATNVGAKFISLKELRLIDCTERTTGVQQQAFYKEPLGVGDLVTSLTLDVREVKQADPIPGTIGEIIVSTICAAATPSRRSH